MQRKSRPHKKLRRAFQAHRDGAKKRGIPFLFNFENWLDVWIKSGKLAQRGSGKDKYCMSRPGDTGPYAEWNVKIILCGDNTREGCLGKPLSALTRAKMSASRKGKKVKPFSAAHKANLSKGRQEMKLSTEHRRKIGLAVTGSKNGFYGRKHSPEVIAKCRAAAMKQWGQVQ